jgi:zinc and cadmium transporter
MELLLWIIGFSLIGGLLSVIVASSFLLLSNNARNLAVPHLVSFAIGALLGASFLGLIPHAMEHEYAVDPHNIGLTLLLGLLSFFLLEKMVLWRHCHSVTIVQVIYQVWSNMTLILSMTNTIIKTIKIKRRVP